MIKQSKESITSDITETRDHKEWLARLLNVFLLGQRKASESD